MTINIMQIIIIVALMVGVGWAYPRLPSPWNWVLVGIVAIVCVVGLLMMFNMGSVRLG